MENLGRDGFRKYGLELVRGAGILWVFATWMVVSAYADSPMLPNPLAVLAALYGMVADASLFPHLFSSLYTIAVGFLVASVAGTGLGILMHSVRAIRLMLMPVVDAVRPVAALTMFPVLILLLGLGVKSRAFVILWTAWPAILINTLHGLDTVDRSVIEAAQIDGANEWAMLRYLKVPLALPLIVTGLRIGLSGGWISLVSSEMLGASSGLGFSVLAYSQTFRFPEMYAIIIVIALVGLIANLGLSWVQDRINGGSYESPFLAFNDRAIGLGGLRSRKH